MRLPRNLKGRSGVVLDTMFFIYLFEDHDKYASICEELLLNIERGTFSGVVTPVTMAELVIKPLKAERLDVARSYRGSIMGFPNMEQSVVDADVGWMAGVLRAKYGFALPDMIQVASALQYPTPTIITNDRDLKKVDEVEVVLLDDLC